ncbi:MAG: TIGR03545 family protein [Bdellovibrionota bacterium]
MADEIKTPKKIKVRTGMIRWEAIVPVTIILLLIGIYMTLFFDANMRSLGQWGLSKVNKAEVNIGSLETSFRKLSFRLQGLEFTDRVSPERNLFQIGDIRFDMSWDAILRAKVFIEEAGVEGIKYGQLRKKPGYVLPVEPEKEDGPSLFSASAVKDKALNKLESDYSDNVFGDIAAMLQGGTSADQIKGLEDQIQAKQMIAKFQKDVEQKKLDWDQRIKALPQAAYFEDVRKRSASIKTSNFSNPQEALQNIQAADKLIKEVDAKVKDIQKTSSDAQLDFKNLDQTVKDIDQQVKADIKDLEKHFKIPKIDAKAFVMAMVSGYIAPYKSEIDKYYKMAYKYAPPNLVNKSGKDEEGYKIQPRARAEGISYEFGRQNSYPLLWVRKIKISSDLGKDPQNGNIAGQISDLTTSQILTGKPTKATLAGDFPAQQLYGFATELTFDNRTPENTLVDLVADLKSYPIANKQILKNKDVDISLLKSQGGLHAQASFVNFRDIKFAVASNFSKLETQVNSPNEVLKSIVGNVFRSLDVITADIKGDGRLPAINLSLNSNLGEALESGFRKELEARIAELRKKIETQVNETIARERQKVEAEVAKLKAQVEGEIKKIQAMADKEIKANQEKVNVAKKDTENKAQDAVKKEGQKAVDDLKKKLGF